MEKHPNSQNEQTPENSPEADRLANFPEGTDVVREYPDRFPEHQPDQLNVARTIEEAADDELSNV